MSVDDGEGALFLPPGADLLDVVIALRQAAPVGPYPELLAHDLQERRRYPNHDQFRSTGLQTPSRFAPGRFIIWQLDAEYDDAVHAELTRSPLPRTLRASQALARELGERHDPGWQTRSFFPYWFALQCNERDGQGPVSEQWDPREEYLFMAREVFIPNGWTSYLNFPDQRDTWGTVPSHDEPVRLPADFEWTECDEWSLFDRPAAP